MELVPISEAKAKLAELVRDSETEDVVLLRHGRPAAVMLSARRHEELMRELEDLSDNLAVYEAEDDTITLDELDAELGLKTDRISA